MFKLETNIFAATPSFSAENISFFKFRKKILYCHLLKAETI